MKNALLLITLLILLKGYSQSYQTAESAEYDLVNNRWLISNGNDIIVDDGQGNLSFFGLGMANTGIEIMGNVLFAVQGADIVGYNLTTEIEVARLTIPGAVFLNGLTNDGMVLFVTDFTTRKIYLADFSDLENPFFLEFVANTINSPNGIVYDIINNRLVYVCWGANAAIRSVNRTTAEVSLIINSGLQNLDGIDEDSNNNFYVSSWNPARITKYNNDFTTDEVVPTPILNSPADIGYSKETDILAIPIFSDVVFYDNSTLGVAKSDIGTFSISPNPVSSFESIFINLNYHSEIILDLYDLNGRKIAQIFKGTNYSESLDISLIEYNLRSGVYFLKLESHNSITTKKLVVN